MARFTVDRQQTSTGFWYKLFESNNNSQIAECFDTIHGDGLDEPAPAPFKTNSDWVNADAIPETGEKYGADYENVRYQIDA